MNCKSCGKLIEADSFFCKYCGSRVEELWSQRIYDDESFWFEPAFNNFPEIIALEYRRLKEELFKKEKTYGVLLQIKDIFEILLKLPTLILVSQIHHQKEHSEEEKKILQNLLSRKLTLGVWKGQIADKIKKLTSLDLEIMEIEKSIINIYEEEQIINWRNVEIGHGALGFDYDDKFKNNIEQKLKSIKKHLEKTAKIYSKLKFEINKEGERSKVYLKLSNKSYQLAPYILYEEDNNQGQICFFDSYLSKKESSSILDYIKGNKFKRETPQIVKLYKRLSNNLTSIIHKGNLISSVEDNTLPKEMEDMLNEVAGFEYYQEPTELKKWLKKLVESNDKGVFLLQMEGGTGKTVFSRALDEQSLNKMKSFTKSSLSKRAYYINDSYGYKVNSFKTDVVDSLRGDENKKLKIGSNHPVLHINSNNKKKNKNNFAKLLDDYLKLHSKPKFFGTDKLLFIIDGLDEIPAKKDQEGNISIFDLIPDSQILAEGVYILLTCRTKEELKDYHREQIARLNISDEHKLTVKKKDEINKDMIENYLSSHLEDELQINTQDQIEEVLRAADYKLLYLSLFKAIAESKNFTLADLKDSDSKFIAYFDLLKSTYGNKFFDKIKRILLIIATSIKPLTIKEISYLFGEEKLTFELLIMISDLKPLLKFERSSRGNLIYIFHHSLKMLIEKEYKYDIEKIIMNWWDNFLSLEAQNIDYNNSGEIYLISYIGFYLKRYLDFIKFEDQIDAKYRYLLKNAEKLKLTIGLKDFLLDILFWQEDGLNRILDRKKDIISAKETLNQDIEVLKKALIDDNKEIKNSLIFLKFINNKDTKSYLINKAKEWLDNGILIEDSLEILRYSEDEESKEYLINKAKKLLNDSSDPDLIHTLFFTLDDVIDKKENKKYLIYKAIELLEQELMELDFNMTEFLTYSDYHIFDFDKETNNHLIDKLIELSDYFYSESIQDIIKELLKDLIVKGDNNYLMKKMRQISEKSSGYLEFTPFSISDKLEDKEAKLFLIDIGLKFLMEYEYEPTIFEFFNKCMIFGDKDRESKEIKKYLIDSIKDILLKEDNYFAIKKLVAQEIVIINKEDLKSEYQYLLNIAEDILGSTKERSLDY